MGDGSTCSCFVACGFASAGFRMVSPLFRHPLPSLFSFEHLGHRSGLSECVYHLASGLEKFMEVWDLDREHFSAFSSSWGRDPPTHGTGSPQPHGCHRAGMTSRTTTDYASQPVLSSAHRLPGFDNLPASPYPSQSWGPG